MAYNFNPHRHVKIWLSKDQDIFLNLENRVRLVRMRDINPDDEICFIYDSRLLSIKALEELESFCSKYGIIPKDVEKDVTPYCHTVQEKKLIELYEDEISHLDEGGNPAVGSDILRWLKPVYERGTYTDFDVHVDTRTLPKTIPVAQPLLMRIGSFTVQSDIETIFLNNDTIAVVDSERALSDIQKVQESIYKSCSRQTSDKNVFKQFINTYIKKLAESFSPFMMEIIINQDVRLKIIPILAELSTGRTLRELRKEVIKITATNLSFAKNILGSNLIPYLHLTDNQIIRKAASVQRRVLEAQLGWLSWLFLPKNEYQSNADFVLIKDDNELLTRLRKRTRLNLLKDSVVYTSGPMLILQALFAKFYYKRDSVNNDIAPFSFAYYGLDKAFKSENGLPLHANSKNVAALTQSTETGKLNDLSWLEEGQTATALREQLIIEARAHLPHDFHDLREKIETHINKIQDDLKGVFGFYRYRERHAKITALQNIIKHFGEHSFDVRSFNNAISSYRTADVFASIGKSKTKELIDELELFGQRAKHYMLTDDNGTVGLLPSTKPSFR